MPTSRTRMTRNRRVNDFSSAELEWLTGTPHDGANKFTLLNLRYLCGPERIEAAEDLLTRARSWLPAERIKVIEKHIDAAVANLREYTDFANWQHPRHRK